MREIKFRAWDKNNSKMVHSRDNFRSKGEQTLGLDLDGQPLELYWEQYYPSISTADNVMLMQYTGLKDKNGKEIYEGDIVFEEDGEYSKTTIIEWDNVEACFFGKDIYTDDAYSMHEIYGEIIGNIYENPTLLTPNTQ